MSGIVHGPEAAADALIAKLRAELPAKIAAINTEAGDEYSLEPPFDNGDGRQGVYFGTRSSAPYPSVNVLLEGPDEPIDTSGRLHFRERIRIVTWLEDGDEEALARKLSRYRRAVREVALHYRRPGGSYVDVVGGYGLQLETEDPGPTFEGTGDDAGRFTSWVSSTFTVQQQQDL